MPRTLLDPFLRKIPEFSVKSSSNEIRFSAATILLDRRSNPLIINNHPAKIKEFTVDIHRSISKRLLRFLSDNCDGTLYIDNASLTRHVLRNDPAGLEPGDRQLVVSDTQESYTSSCAVCCRSDGEQFVHKEFQLQMI